MSKTPEAAITEFWSGFGIPAYTSNAVPEDATYPYLTYEIAESRFEDGPVNTAVQIWYHTDSEAEPNAKVREISEAIGRGGVMLSCSDGAIWVIPGSPFRLNVNDSTDRQVKLRQLNIMYEWQI